MKHKLKNLVTPLMEKMWRGPKGKLVARVRAYCDKLTQKQRVSFVAVILTVFVLIAFCVFGHACYMIGVGQTRKTPEIEHIRQLELPTKSVADEYAR